MNPKLVHKHLLIRAEVKLPPLYSYSSSRLDEEIKNLVKNIDMEVMSGPHSAYCVEPGNQGWSSTALITTSSITFHSWTELDLIQLDVYSCKDFKIKDVFMWLAQFELEKLDYKYLDREQGFKTLADQELNHWDNKQYNLNNLSWKDEVLYE